MQLAEAFGGRGRCRSTVWELGVQHFRGRLVFKAHRLLYHSPLGLRVMKKKKSMYQDGVKRVL